MYHLPSTLAGPIPSPQGPQQSTTSAAQPSSSTPAAIAPMIHHQSASPVNPKLPFPERFVKSTEDKQIAKFLDMMTDMQITTPILDGVLQVPMYTQFFKDQLAKKRNINEPELVTLTKECSALVQISYLST